MSAKKDISYLLKNYSLNEGLTQFELIDFCLFVRKYASKYSSENPELAIYENIGTQELGYELQKLKDSGDIDYKVQSNGNAIITVAHFYVEKLKKIFRAIAEKPSLAFPSRHEIPKDIPSKFLKKIKLSEEFAKIEQNDDSLEIVYELSFGSSLPTMVFPSSIGCETILFFSLLKLKDFLDKDENNDYVHKRLLVANPGKSFTIKTFLSNIKLHTNDAIESIKQAGEIYLLWGQLCTFITQEFDKKSEKLVEEQSLLQAIKIIEFMTTYYRTKSQKKLQKETALKNLYLAFQKQPYYFTLLEITNFADSRGIPLLGQYDQSDLQDYINKATSETNNYTLPDLLMFKNENEDTFFVLTEKVISLIIFLINQNRKKIRDQIIQNWKNNLINFNETAEMKNNESFEAYLKELTRSVSNNLYSILQAKFLVSLASDRKIIETQPIEYSRIFPQGRLATYSKLFILDRAETLNDVKILLPFWYGIPIIYKIVAFFKGKLKPKERKTIENKESKNTEKQKPISIAEQAKKLESYFLQENQTYDQAIKKQLENWNQNLNDILRNNLTEDVNALIRDCIRGIQRTLTVKSLTANRIQELANRIVNTPSLKTITDKKALQKYCELYILNLLQKFF